MVRRAGALVVLVALVLGVVRLGGAVFGSDGTDAASPDVDSPDTAAGVTGDAGTDPAGAGADAGPEATSAAAGPAGVAGAAGASAAATDSSAGADSDAGTASSVATTEEPAGPPTPANPATVLIAGDSDAGTFGPYLERLLAGTGVVRTTLDYKVSSGLSRPDFFDWPSHFRTTIPTLDPDIVVVTFGGNDPQGLTVVEGSTAGAPNFIVSQPTGAPGGDAEWRAEYGRRVGEVMDHLAADGRTLVWVGIPNDDNPDVTARLAVQNEVVVAEAAKRPHVVFIDTWRRFSGRNGGWAEYVIDPRDGQGKDVRADDGFHLNVDGAEILALDIAEAVKADLRTRGATI